MTTNGEPAGVLATAAGGRQISNSDSWRAMMIAEIVTGTVFAGADWIRGNWEKYDKRGRKVSELGARVADLLGAVYEGIYHLNQGSLMRADWSHLHFIEVTVPGGISTFDNSILTKLVVAAHDRSLRIEMKGISGWGYLRLTISGRDRTADWYRGHPTLEKNIRRQRSLMLGKRDP